MSYSMNKLNKSMIWTLCSSVKQAAFLYLNSKKDQQVHWPINNTVLPLQLSSLKKDSLMLSFCRRTTRFSVYSCSFLELKIVLQLLCSTRNNLTRRNDSTVSIIKTNQIQKSSIAFKHITYCCFSTCFSFPMKRTQHQACNHSANKTHSHICMKHQAYSLFNLLG